MSIVISEHACIEKLQDNLFVTNVLRLPHPSALKDQQFRFVGVNGALTDLVGYSHPKLMLGTTDYDLPCDAARFAERFQQYDSQCLTYGSIQTVDIYQYRQQITQILLTTKLKVTLDEEDYIWTQTPAVNIAGIARKLSQLDRGGQSLDVTFTVDHENSILQNLHLTEQQKIVFFYTLHGQTSKQIAKQLGLSFRTIEMHIDNIKAKLDCGNKSDIITKGLSLGYGLILPSSLLL